MISKTVLILRKGSEKLENPAWKICQRDICPSVRSRLEIPLTNPYSVSHLMLGHNIRNDLIYKDKKNQSVK
jgi:hypothetical protein